MIRERNSCRVAWVSEDPRLVFQVEARIDDHWIPVKDGRVQTQVWPREDEEMRALLLEKLLDRIEPRVREALPGAAGRERLALPGGREFFAQLQWFGPEMAEEY